MTRDEKFKELQNLFSAFDSESFLQEVELLEWIDLPLEMWLKYYIIKYIKQKQTKYYSYFPKISCIIKQRYTPA